MMQSTPVGRRVGVAMAAALLASSSASAQTVETLGTRALGMAGAFVAVADDATAPYWNPAGLATGAVFNLLLERQVLDLTPDMAPEAETALAEDASGIVVGIGTPPLGLAYYRLRSTHVEVPRAAGGSGVTAGTLITHHTAVTLLQSLGDAVVVGTALKYVRGVAARQVMPAGPPRDELLDAAGALVGKASNALDLDLGVMANLGRARVGLVARNLRQPDFETPDGDEIELERQIRIGLALYPSEGFVVSTDLDLTENVTPGGRRRELALGLERWLGRHAGVRGGFRVNLEGDASPVGALGLSVAIWDSHVWLDAQVTRGADDSERGWGLGLRIAF